MPFLALVQDNRRHGRQNHQNADDRSHIEVLIQEDDSQYDGCHRLQGPQYGCHGRTDSSDGLDSCKVGYHCGPEAESQYVEKTFYVRNHLDSTLEDKCTHNEIDSA